MRENLRLLVVVQILVAELFMIHMAIVPPILRGVVADHTKPQFEEAEESRHRIAEEVSFLRDSLLETRTRLQKIADRQASIANHQILSDALLKREMESLNAKTGWRGDISRQLENLTTLCGSCSHPKCFGLEFQRP